MPTIEESLFPDSERHAHDGDHGDPFPGGPGTPDNGDEGDGTGGAPQPRRRSVWKLFGISVLALLTVVALLLAGGAWYLGKNLKAIDGNIERFVSPNQEIPEAERPSVYAPEAQNYLLLGSDSRISAGDPSQWTFGAQRTDAIMILHIPADRERAYVISIPRDSWVSIPGRSGQYKINAAFSYGGPTLLVRTVEKLTGVRIDHVVIADFEGFKQITDRLGGVDIAVPGRGTVHMDGEEALVYVRTRKTLRNGDFDRIKRQQNWIRTVLRDLMSADTVRSPGTLLDSLKLLSKNVSTDEDLSIDAMKDLAWSMRSVRSKDITFMTVPLTGTGRSPDGKQSIVKLDRARDKVLFEAVRKDRLGDYLEDNDADVLGSKVD